jgi:hypothetical protein
MPGIFFALPLNIAAFRVRSLLTRPRNVPPPSFREAFSMNTEPLKQALRGPVTRVAFELIPAGVRWELWNGDERTYHEEATGDQIHDLAESTEVLLQLKLGVLPTFLAQRRSHRAARQSETN